MKKKVMMSVMATAMILSNNITALAAPEVIEVNGINEVFDCEYYANMYPDVTAEVGTSKEALIQHYTSFGKREGRTTYATGTDVNAILAAYQETNPVAGTVAPVQTEKKLLLRKDSHVIDYNDDGSIEEWDNSVSYEYDAEENLIRLIRSIYGRVDDWSFEYSYDNQGNLIKELQIAADNSENYETIYTYNDQGDVIKEAVRNWGRDNWGYDYSDTYDITYSYDSQGNILNRVFWGNDSEYLVDTYSYDNWGNCVQKNQTSVYPDGTVTEYERVDYYYTYDEYGTILKKEEVDNLSDTYYRTVIEYSYDSQGNILTEHEYYSCNGELSSISTTQYIYK